MVLSIWSLRPRSSPPLDLRQAYGEDSNFFTLKIHHDGGFSNCFTRRSYVEGYVAYFDYVDVDLFSIHELDEMLTDLGYNNGGIMFYHFMIPGSDLDRGLLPLATDQDVYELSKYVPGHKEISVYIEHGKTKVVPYVSLPIKAVIEDLEGDASPEMNRDINKRALITGSCSRKLDLNVSSQLQDSIVPYVPSKPVLDRGENLPFNEQDLFDDFDPFLGAHFDDIHQNDYHAMGDVDAEFDKAGEEVPLWENENGTEDCGNEDSESEDSEDEDSEDEDYIVDSENQIDDVEVDMRDFNFFVDADVEWIPKTVNVASGSVTQEVADEDLDVIDPDSFEAPVVDEDDYRERHLRQLNKVSTCSQGEVHETAFKLGQTFKTKKDVKEYINMHSIDTKRHLNFEKNDKTRIRAVCKGVVPDMSSGPHTKSRMKCRDKAVETKEGKCPWVVLVSRRNETEDWIVKTIVNEHRCVQSRRIRACNYKFLAKNIVKQIEGNPTIPIRALQEELMQKYEMGMSRMKVHRAKNLAQKHVFGDYVKQYGSLRDYALELIERNPGTNVKIDVYPEPNYHSDSRIFRRIYVCLGALKLGFKANQREFLGLDGAFLKGPHPGQILTAVGVDSNNGIYPLAYGIVEAETTQSWTWFLEQLGEDLDLQANSNFTFISDRQKGIIPALAKVFPQAEHRFCLRHIHENMKLQWRDKELKDMVWNCATATTVRHFERALEEMKAFNVKAHDWLLQIHPSHWARSHFSGRAHTNIMLNNMCEVLNSKLIDGRDKPIIYCLEFIREYLMKRICNVQKEIDRSHGPLTPTATKLLDEMKKHAVKNKCIFNGDDKTQVTGQWGDQFVVNLKEKSCSCRHWEISGMLCSHAISAIWDKIEHGAKNVPELEKWVHPCYWLITWKEVYKHKVEPINGRLMWPKSQCPTVLTAPKHVPQVGRPKKKRKRAFDEPASQGNKLSKKWATVTCGKCHNKGHNSRTCKGQGGVTGKTGGGTRAKKQVAAMNKEKVK